jgi:hypothetical protein
MGALWRTVAHVAVCDPEADPAQGFSAVEAWDLEQTPERGDRDRCNQYEKKQS